MSYSTRHLSEGPRLSPRIWRLLRRGDERNEYGHDTLRMSGAIIMEAARAGHDLGQLQRLLEDERNLGGDWYRTNCQRDGKLRAERELSRQFDKALARVRQQLADANEVLLVLAELDRHAGAWWSDRRAVSRRKTYLAHTSVARRARCLTYSASMRQLAEIAHIHREVVRRSTAELRKQGLLRLTRPARVTHATTWTLVRVEGANTDPLLASPPPSSTGSTLHPAFRHGTGLDGRIWDTLDDNDTLTATEIAAAIGMSVATARRNLNRLRDHDLAIRDDDLGWKRLGTPQLLDAIAERNGAAARSNAQRQRHLLERHEHHHRPRRPHHSPETTP